MPTFAQQFLHSLPARRGYISIVHVALYIFSVSFLYKIDYTIDFLYKEMSD